MASFSSGDGLCHCCLCLASPGFGSWVCTDIWGHRDLEVATESPVTLRTGKQACYALNYTDLAEISAMISSRRLFPFHVELSHTSHHPIPAVQGFGAHEFGHPKCTP